MLMMGCLFDYIQLIQSLEIVHKILAGIGRLSRQICVSSRHLEMIIYIIYSINSRYDAQTHYLRTRKES